MNNIKPSTVMLLLLVLLLFWLRARVHIMHPEMPPEGIHYKPASEL